jgi:tyrosyl-DNA phosphodiesterase-1
MLVLFRHDDCVQVIIHTANMTSRDWTNMSQAVWRSPLLPLLSSTISLDSPDSKCDSTDTYPIGNGDRFKVDLLRYLKAYGNRVKSLTTDLAQYDFSTIRAAFIGSAPSRQKPAAAEPSKQTSFGWLGLKEILSTVPNLPKIGDSSSPPHIIVQISSIATLGAVPTWLTHFQSILARAANTQTTANGKLPSGLSKASNFFAKPPPRAPKQPVPKFNIIFPTPEEIRTSLDGYASGHSIHVKLQSTQQQKQLEYLHPLFCHWKSPATSSASTHAPASIKREALRGPAAPHIKTYVRFSDDRHETIDWAMVTSANLSKQAWGDVVNKKDEIWIQSWEAGVVVWPDLFSVSDTTNEAVMVPVFGKDIPGPKDLSIAEVDMVVGKYGVREAKTIVGFRMPYDLPLSPYGPDDKPWCATMQYQEPDWMGSTWGGYQNR